MAYQGTNLPKTAYQKEEVLYGLPTNNPELVVMSVSHVGWRWQESCSLEPQTHLCLATLSHHCEALQENTEDKSRSL